MKRLLFLLTFLCFAQMLFSQKSITGFKNSLKTSSSSIKDVIPIVNDSNNDIAIFFADAKNVYGYLFNEKFELQNELLSPEKRRKYKVLIGSSILENGRYRIFLTNKAHTKFSSMTLSFNKELQDLNEFNLEDLNERFIQTAKYNNKFYLISAAKKSPQSNLYGEGVYVYSFDGEGKPKRNKIDISQLFFIGKNGLGTSLPNLIVPYAKSINKIENNVPNSIEVAASDRKMFTQKNKIIFSFDNNKEFSQFFEINLETFEASQKSFEKPMKANKKNRKETNSYLNDNFLFTVASTKDDFIFQVSNYDTDSILNRYSFSKNDSITFKNTPIIQEGGAFDNYRELELSKKFLRKITANKLGVSTIKIKDMYHVTIGGYIEQRNGGIMPMGGFGPVPIANLGNVNMFFNPTMFAYHSIINTKSTRIECLFDDEFDHLGGDIPENAFDKIDSFLTNDIGEGETIFSYKDYFILLDRVTGTNTYYTLRKFKE